MNEPDFTTEPVGYDVDGQPFESMLVHRGGAASKPLVLVAPNWFGMTEPSLARVARIVGDNYVGLLADMYGGGHGVTGGVEEAKGLADGLRQDAAVRRRRIVAALEAFRQTAKAQGLGDAERVAAVGFCLGGGNVLELARTGARLRGAISIHGDLTTTRQAGPGDLHSPLLVLHGSVDPVEPKENRDTFEAEMTAAGADWQMHVMGGLVHSFSEEDAHVPGIAQYDRTGAEHAYRLTGVYLAEWLAD